ncbi:hypothetical protein [Nitratireductor sp.]|uniref:hypothetical protein n=1 Tax=Nitratireductor sp. TaxID=1872084 RepID=UPI0025D07C19|nr:hypothetical protein [Nitratireductor sp.]
MTLEASRQNETLPQVNMLWIGGELGPIEIMSALSFLEAGHKVVLHSYDHVKNTPFGVQEANAEKVVPGQRISELRHHKTGSFALASDYFRFRLQQEGLGLWADLDMICLKPVTHLEDIVIGKESNTHINGAILYARKGHPIVEETLAFFDNASIPPWTRTRDVVRLRLAHHLLGKTISPAALPWGSFGPKAITYLARKHGVFDLAAPRDVFYPIDFREAPILYDAHRNLDEFCTERTKTVHLWNEVLRSAGLKSQRPPSGSPLATLLQRFNV